MKRPENYQIVAWQRLEGLLLAIFALYAYANANASWLMFAILILAPDALMVGYLASTKIGAFFYNAAHSLVFPLALLTMASISSEAVVWQIGLIWMAHIGFDRMFGLGLKFNDNFKHTHLGNIGER